MARTTRQPPAQAQDQYSTPRRAAAEHRAPSLSRSASGRQAPPRTASRPSTPPTPAPHKAVRKRPAPETGSSITMDRNVLQVRVPMPEVHLSWQKQLLLFAAVSIGAVAAMIVLRSWVSQLGAWGYAGAFLISMLSSASIVLPAPGAAIIIVMAQDYNPWLLGVSAGLGGGLGGTTAYFMGRLGSRSLQKKGFFKLGSKVMARVGPLLIFVFNLVPFLPGDLTSLLAGGTSYPFLRFFTWMTLGYVLKMVAICYAAVSSVAWIQQWMDRLGL